MERVHDYWVRYRFAVVAAVIVLTVVASLATRQFNRPAGIAAADILSTGTPAPETAGIIIDIEGAVAVPGVRKLPAGALIEDAIAAAGGLTDQADQIRIAQQINRATALKDHQKLYLPIIGERPAATGSGETSSGNAAVDALVNLNTATLDELDSLPGVGATTAQKIIDYREANGPFGAVEDLKEVPGIGDAKFEKLKDKITI